ncbi:hypothetical protein QCA50_010801 [Cerrena zonata]|uniref:Uncharacterized protein n=1 Tax=Cerrena zonata TaxID=2478898 RepID=A0AAW0GAA5_9APHY
MLSIVSKRAALRYKHTGTTPIRGTRQLSSTRTCRSTTNEPNTSTDVPKKPGLLSWAQSNSKISSVFSALILLGIGSTAYGVYEFYQMFTLWPLEVRGDLRAGIKAKNNGDFVMSERFLRRALETANQLPLDRLSPEPYLKLSGIAIVLGEVLEKANRPQEAYEVYETALAQLQNPSPHSPVPAPPSPTNPDAPSPPSPELTRSSYTLTGPERVRAATISFKLAEMADTYTLPLPEQEKHLVYTVEELLRVIRDYNGVIPNKSELEEQEVALGELELPSWVSKLDLVVPLETLGGFYGKTGKEEFAVPLYLSALSVLSPSRRSTVETRCQGAHIMNSLASSLTQKPTPERRKQAEIWLRKALHVIDETKTVAKHQNSPTASEDLGQCELTLAVALFNLGELREMAGDNHDARKWYTASRKQSSIVKLREGVIEADVALRRLEKTSKSDT